MLAAHFPAGSSEPVIVIGNPRVAVPLRAAFAATPGIAHITPPVVRAGFVLSGTFAVLATIPSTFTTELGFAVAFGILLDTIVVRSVLVTALNLDVGRWMGGPASSPAHPTPRRRNLGKNAPVP